MSDIQWIIVFTMFWCMISMNFKYENMILGVIISIFSLFLSGKRLIGKSFSEKYPLNLFVYTRFFIFLIFKIYMAAFSSIKTIFVGADKPEIITFKTELKEEFARTILANSISLTPGTLTMYKEDDEIKVLWLEPKTRDHSKARELIIGDFERLLKHGENK